MTKKIVAFVLAAALLFSAAACSRVKYTEPTSSVGESSFSVTENPQTDLTDEEIPVSEEIPTESVTMPSTETTQPDTTAKESTTLLTAVTSVIETSSRIISTATTRRPGTSTTRPTTERTTTTKPSTTKPTTTKPTTTKHTTTKSSTTKASGTIAPLSSATATAPITPGEFTGTKYGVRVTKSLNGTITVDRSGYRATYNELVPAAKGNRKYYSDMIKEIFRITNEYRAERFRKALTFDEKLTEQACVRAEEIAWSAVWSHTRPDGSRFSSIFEYNGYVGFKAENLGHNFNNAKDVCAAWKDSTTHYINILDSTVEIIGIGVAPDPDPNGQQLVFVQHFYSTDGKSE